MPRPWKLSPDTSAYGILMQTMSAFAEAAKASGDMENYYRWRNVMHDAKVRASGPLLPGMTSATAEATGRELLP